MFRPKIYFPQFNPNPSIPPFIETAGGWAGFFNGGVGVTGGTGGTVRDYTNAITMIDELNNSSPLVPEIYVYDGHDNFDLTWIRRWCTGKSNKTIMCSEGQGLLDGEIRFEFCNNIIIRNIRRAGLSQNHTTFGGDDMDGFTINSCDGVWIDHVEIDGESNWGTNEDNAKYWDGGIDTNLSNHITVSNSIFKDTDKAMLIGYSDTQEANIGLLNVTVRNSVFRNIRQRQPLCRWGKIGLHQNYMTWDPDWGTSVLNRPTVSRNISVRTRSQIWSEGNYYGSVDQLFLDDDPEVIKLSGLKSTNDFILSADPNYISEIRPELVDWSPSLVTNYTLPIDLSTPEQAKDYALQWAGAKYHLKNAIV